MKPLQVIVLVLGAVALMLFIYSCSSVLVGASRGYCQANPGSTRC